MSDNENVKAEDEKVEELGDEPSDEASTDWKAEALKARGIAKRNATRLQKLNERLKTTKVETPADIKPKETKTEFDYAEKAYLKASGIKSDEFPLVKEIMASTGKSLDEVLEAKYFQAELKELREEKSSKDAIPAGSKRSSPGTRDSVDYWIAKGELPPPDQQELRSKVVKEKRRLAGSGSPFSSRPVV